MRIVNIVFAKAQTIVFSDLVEVGMLGEKKGRKETVLGNLALSVCL